MVPAGNKAKRLLSYNHTIKTTILEGHILTKDISVNMFEIELSYNLNSGNITSQNPQNEISASHKKIKRIYPDDNESKDIEESDSTEDNHTTDCKNWIMDPDVLQSNIPKIAVCHGCQTKTGRVFDINRKMAAGFT